MSRNATKHGSFSAVPVLPGECAQTWESHRAGVVESLSPVGALALNLTERVALLLCRLQRLARYEVEVVAASVEAAEVPPLPSPEEEDHFGQPPPRQPTRDEQLRDIRRELRSAREELEHALPGRDYLRLLSEPGSAGVAPFAVAESVLEAGCALCRTRRGTAF